MRISWLALLTTLLIASPSFAQTPWANKLFGNEVAHDFGTVAPGAQLSHTFKVTNIYKVPLEITDIRLFCDCVKVETSTRSLKPTESGTLTVLMDARKFTGPRTVKIQVSVGPKFTSTATLLVSANARGGVLVTPKEVDFGSVARGNTPTKSVDIEHFDKDATWQVTEIRNSAASPFNLKVEFLPNNADGSARKGYRLFATLKADAPAGAFKQEVVLMTNDPAKPTITVPIVGGVQAGLVLSPAVVSFKGIKVGETQSKKVFLRAARPVTVLKVEGQADGITVDFDTTKEATQVLTVSFRAAKAGELRRQLTIRTDLDGASAPLTVEATVAP